MASTVLKKEEHVDSTRLPDISCYRRNHPRGEAGARVLGVPGGAASRDSRVPPSPAAVSPTQPHRQTLLHADLVLLRRGLRHRAMTAVAATVSPHPPSGHESAPSPPTHHTRVAVGYHRHFYITFSFSLTRQNSQCVRLHDKDYKP